MSALTADNDGNVGLGFDAVMSSGDEVSISKTLLEARRTAVALAGFPETPPADFDSAYRVQQRSIPLWPDTVAGWKVGGVPPQWREKLEADWLVGPIFSRSVKSARDREPTEMPVYKNGFAAIEPELVIQLGAARKDDRMFIGAEIASSPVPGINDYGPTAVVCDFGNNNGLLLGNEIEDWSSMTAPLEVSISINGETVGRRVIESLSDQALSARDFCIEHARRQGRPLEPGYLISTGAITGIHEADIGARSRISFSNIGNLDLVLVAANPASGA